MYFKNLELLIGGVLITILATATATATICTSEGYVLKEAVRYVPKNRMEYEEVAKSLQCSSANLKLTFLLSTWKNGTIVGCFCNVKIFGKYCTELNIGSKYRVQANYGAPCDNFPITPCPDPYNSSESYIVWQCFVEYGNILSPWELALENENFQRTVNDLKRDLQIRTNLLTDENEKNLMLENKTREQNLTIMKLESELKKREMKEPCTGTSPGAVIGYCMLSVVACVILGIVLFIVKKYCNSIIFHIRRLFTNNQTQQPHVPNSVTSNQNMWGNNSEERRNNEDIPSVIISSCTDKTTQSTAIEDFSQKKNVDNENESKDKAGELTYDDHDDNNVDGFSPEEADLLCKNLKHSITNDDDTDDDVDDELEGNQTEDDTAAFQLSTTVSRS